MNSDIKEIYLSEIVWTKIAPGVEITQEDKGGVKGTIVLKDSISHEEYQRFFMNTYYALCSKDYINNLQEKLQRQEAYIKYLEERTPIQSKKYYGDGREELQEKIDKAISYIKERYDYILKCDFLDHDEQVDKRQITYLLNILEGDDNNGNNR